MSLPPRISAREAAACVADAADPELARALRKGTRGNVLAKLPPDLDGRERVAFVACVEGSGFGEALRAIGWALNGRRMRRIDLPGRRGAPARDWLRAELRNLRERARELLPPHSQRRATRVIAMLVLLYGLDQHRAFWRANGRTPPVGRARVRWLTERVGDLVDDDSGQYAARRANRLGK
jgi:hypothetical protein